MSREVPCVAVSPIVGGAALRGPAAEMLRALGRQASPVGVAELYSDIVDAMVIDEVDATASAELERAGIRAVVTDTIMRDAGARHDLAVVALETAGISVNA